MRVLNRNLAEITGKSTYEYKKPTLNKSSKVELEGFKVLDGDYVVDYLIVDCSNCLDGYDCYSKGIHLENIDGALKDCINTFKNLERLELYYITDLSFPAKMPTNINYLEMVFGTINNIDSIESLVNLIGLYLQVDSFNEFPNLNGLINLETLVINGSDIQTLEIDFTNLTNLTHLLLGWNRLTSIPNSIGDLSNLEYLILGGNKLTTLPDAIGGLSRLRYLDLSVNNLNLLTDTIGNLVNLEQLILTDNGLTTLPDSISNLTNLHYLDLYGNNFTEAEVIRISSLIPAADVFSDFGLFIDGVKQ